MVYTKEGNALLSGNEAPCCDKCIYLNYKAVHSYCRKDKTIPLNTYVSPGGRRIFFRPETCPGQELRREFLMEAMKKNDKI